MLVSRQRWTLVYSLIICVVVIYRLEFGKVIGAGSLLESAEPSVVLDVDTVTPAPVDGELASVAAGDRLDPAEYSAPDSSQSAKNPASEPEGHPALARARLPLFRTDAAAAPLAAMPGMRTAELAVPGSQYPVVRLLRVGHQPRALSAA
jgi:hypothetical protein